MMNEYSSGNNNYDDVRLSILTVADKCGIDYDIKPYAHGRYLAHCPFCDSSSKKLSLTTDSGKGYKNVYKCYKCGESGSAIKLYATLKGLNNKEAFKELITNGDVNKNTKIEKIIKKGNEIPSCLETADLDTLDKVYKDFIKLLKLDRSSYENLKSRGIDDDYIRIKGYKSIPANYQERYEITNKLINMGHRLEGIAGFYKDEYNKWTFNGTQGYLVPIRDLNGRINSFQIRMNQKINKLRYTYFTSSKYSTGAKALAIPNVSLGKNTDYIYITEGPLKGDIASFFSGDTFFSVPGVNAGIDILIKYLKEVNPIKVIICYDMDMYEIPEVKNALVKLINKLNDVGIYSELKLWDKKYKGIDDYYYSFDNTK